MRNVSIRGRVLLPEPVEDAVIELLTDVGGEEITIALDGRFEADGIAPGRYRIEVRAGPFFEAPLHREILIEHDIDGLEITVERGRKVSGTVLDQNDNPVPGCEVSLFSKGEGWSETTNAEGRFEFEGVRPGRVHLEYMDDRVDLEVGDGDVEVPLRYYPPASIRGRVIDVHGVPVAGVDIVLGHKKGKGITYRMNMNSAGAADGKFLFEGLRAGRYSLEPERSNIGKLRKPDGTSAEVRLQLEPGQDEEIEIMVEALSERILGRVVNEQGRPFPGVSVAAARELTDEDRKNGASIFLREVMPGTVLTNFEGRFLLERVSAGTYSMVAYRALGEALFVRGVHPEQHLTLMLDPPGRVTFRLLDESCAALDSATLNAVSGRFIHRHEELSLRNGAFVVDALAPGKWMFDLVSGERSLELAVVVRAGRTTDLGSVIAMPFGILRGRVIDQDGAPISAIEIWASSNGRTAKVSTDSDGRFEASVPSGEAFVQMTYGFLGSISARVEAGAITELSPIVVRADR